MITLCWHARRLTGGRRCTPWSAASAWTGSCSSRSSRGARRFRRAGPRFHRAAHCTEWRRSTRSAAGFPTPSCRAPQDPVQVRKQSRP